MKKLILNTKLSHIAYLLALVAVIFCGCEPTNNEQQKEVKATRVNAYEISNQGVQILTIDS